MKLGCEDHCYAHASAGRSSNAGGGDVDGVEVVSDAVDGRHRESSKASCS